MNKLNNKSGFTLIEIIVVLIIIGILAAIALPNLFSNVSKSKAATAIASMDGAKSSAEGDAQKSGGYPVAANVALPAGAVNGFTITLVPTGAAAVAQSGTSGAQPATAGTVASNNLTYSFKATDGTNSIYLNRAADGSFSCSAPNAGPLSGAC